MRIIRHTRCAYVQKSMYKSKTFVWIFQCTLAKRQSAFTCHLYRDESQQFLERFFCNIRLILQPRSSHLYILFCSFCIVRVLQSCVVYAIFFRWILQKFIWTRLEIDLTYIIQLLCINIITLCYFADWSR